MIDKYIRLRPGSSSWQLIVPVPKAVQAAFGRKIVTKSLGERGRAAAEAKALPILASLHREWSSLNSASPTSETPEPDKGAAPSERDLIMLAGRDIYDQIFEALSARHVAAFTTNPEGYADYVKRHEDQLIRLSAEVDSNMLKRWEPHAARLGSNRGYCADEEAGWRPDLQKMLSDVTIDALAVRVRRSKGDHAAEPRSEVVLKARRFEQQAEQDKVELPFSQVCEDFMRQWNAGRAGNKETNTEQQKRSTFALFAGFWDDKPIRGVTVSDGARFRDALKLFDPHWARSPLARLMSWAELLNRYGNRPRGLAAGTMNRHMAALQELWRWAYKRGHCARDNPFEGYHTKLRPGVNVSPYLAWEMDELRQLLSPPPRRSDLLESVWKSRVRVSP